MIENDTENISQMLKYEEEEKTHGSAIVTNIFFIHIFLLLLRQYLSFISVLSTRDICYRHFFPWTFCCIFFVNACGCLEDKIHALTFDSDQ